MELFKTNGKVTVKYLEKKRQEVGDPHRTDGDGIILGGGCGIPFCSIGTSKKEVWDRG
jgi:hypothetical protein